MLIKQLDYLSPSITFYHKGYLSHKSIFSGILSVITIVFILILAGYYSFEIINRKVANTFFFNSFDEDIEPFQLNSSSLFHFLTSVKNEKGIVSNEKFDLTIFNVIGLNIYYKNYINLSQRALKQIDHWLYGYCNKEANTEGLNDLLKYDFFEGSLCIKKYYKSEEKKYYEIGNPNFTFPEISHGTFNEKNQLYNIIVQKCNNELLSNILGKEYSCKNQTEINKETRILYLYFINNYINILNYEKPNYKFFYRLESPLQNGQFTANDININPALITTHNGLILDNIEEEISYMFDRNDVYIGESENILMIYCFFLKNIKVYYERTYKRIQDVISNIGGMYQLLTLVAIYLNLIYNKYIVLFDTELLLDSSIHLEKQIHKNSVHHRNIKNKMSDLEKLKKFNDINKKSQEKRLSMQNINKNRRKQNKSERENDISYNTKSNNNFSTNNIKESEMIKNWKGKSFEKMPVKYNYNDENEKIKEKKNFCSYLYYRLTCGKENNNFKFFQKFRIKIISEEHLIRNHLNTYNLLKVAEKKRHRRSNYPIKELIKLL